MTTPRIFFRKALVCWLAYAMTFGPGTPAALAQMPDNQMTSADFSNVPLPAKKRPNPNLIFAIDDSGSMDGEISINANDGAAWYYTAGLTVGSGTVDGKTSPGFFGLNFNDKQDPSGPPNFNNVGGANGTWKKYVYLFPNGFCGPNCESRSYADDQHDHFAVSPSQQFGAYRNPEFNRQYYNPTITYVPWKPYNDGTGSCPSGTASGSGTSYLCSPGNANASKARLHPIYGSTTVDLTQDIGRDQNPGYYFRLYDGMRVLPNAMYRRCTGSDDGQGCENWKSNGANVLCVGGNVAAAKTACELGGVGGSGDLLMSESGTNYDHVDMAVDYIPSRLFINTNATFVDATQYAALGFPKASGLDPTGKDMYLIEIKSSNSNYPKFPGRTDCAGSTCTYAEEIQNFANWFQYYRKRHMSLNAAIGNSLDGLNALRAGYFLFNARFDVTMYDFDTIGDFTKNERRLLGLIYRTKGNGGTPTRESLDWMGRQYQRTNSGAPVTHPCQFNSGFIITDGFATSGGPTGYGNYDSTTAGVKGPIGSGYSDPQTEAPLAPRAADPGFFNQQMDDKSVLSDPRGSGKTAPYKDNWSNTMADMAMKFYVENLRPDITQTGRVPIDMNDIAPDADKNPNLHMNTYGLVLGLSGMIFSNPSTQAFVDQTKDPYKNNPSWDTIDPRTQQRSPTAIDELWHATINGRGQMLRADSPEQTRNAVLDVVNNVVAKGGAAAAVSVSNAIPTQGDNFTYQTKYNAGAWAGDLEAFSIDLQSGAVSKTPAWANSAQKQLADRDWKGRTIVTFNPNAGSNGKGVPFEAGSIGSSQLAALGGMMVGATAIPSQWVLDWLRGDRSREAESLRSRGTRRNPQTGNWDTIDGKVPAGVAVLGDLVNAEPLYVREPRSSYFDEGYAAFKSAPARVNRTKVLYAPGNDGMVHVFDALTGAEKWAYVPSFGFKAQTGFTSAGLRNLADKEYFAHRFMVDATPVVSDIDLAKAGNTTTGSSNWATMVVGGLGKGGRGWYAIDATNSDVADEADAATKIMWEFPNANTSANDVKRLGYSYGRPIIAKTRAAGWVVLVASGYENGNETGGDGRGYLFVLNPLNGAVIARIATLDADGAADAADRANNPRGMAYIAGFAGSPNTDATIDYVYGGDLYGNVWRFDLSGANTSDWNVAKLATLTDGTNAQPVTSEPELGVVGSHRVVYVGTGRYYGDKDIPGNTQGTPAEYASAKGKQTIYALKDDRTANPTITGRSSLIAQTVTKANGFANVTNNAVDFDVTKGWYVDLPDLGERVITNPTLAAGALAITSNIPDGGDACLPGGRSWLYAFDYRTGSMLPGATYAGRFLGDALGSRVNMIRVGSGIKGLIRTSAGGTKIVDATAGGVAVSAKRKAWRELIQ